jgi:hypothetical protein
LFISYNTYYYPLDVDPVAVYYWFVAGMILKLPLLDQQTADELSVDSSTISSRRGSRRRSTDPHPTQPMPESFESHPDRSARADSN